MPEMDPDRWRAASLRLDEAMELSGDERARWLAALREQDPTLAEDVRVLLDEYEAMQRNGFLEGSYAFRLGELVDEDAAGASGSAAHAGRTVGAYRLVSEIGHGGMGVVWLAERCDGQFEGRAAVKLLDTRFGRSEARFRREANILARVTHPNISHLIDAGVSSDGQPYLVLEFVDGEPIDRYCDDRKLTVRVRIELFLDVLGAVSHAHTHRIVHRDIKPPNVLVRRDGHVKLLDFGIAKLLEREGQPSMMSTLTLEQGAALTPAYAAPEQVGGGSVTTATDIYALGVLLYVLLTGQHPCGEITSPADLLKAIVDTDAPPPSAVVVAGKTAVTDPAIRAANRAATPERLHRLLKGDLDTIVAKALKKDPLERYASVDELADDLRRHLASEPIRARRDSLRRRTVRFVRRHPALTTAGALGLLAIAVVAGYSTIGPAAEGDRAAVGQAPIPVTSEPGDETWPSLSPDRTRVVFSWVAPNAATTRIAVKTLGSDSVMPLTEGGDDTSPVWSPDGQQIAFIRSFREPEHRRQICLVLATGGPVRVLHAAGYSQPGLAWWTDRNALLFSTREAMSGPFHLAALDLATQEVRILTNPPPAPQLGAPGDFFPSLAPDGRTVAFVRETHEGRDVFLLDLATNAVRRLTRDQHRISGLTWAPDGRAVIMSSPRGGLEGLYRVSLADGTIARVPNTGDGATQPMAHPAGLVYSQTQDDSNIYRIELRDGRALGIPRRIVASSRPDVSPHISPDGRSIAFASTRSGGADVWVAAADGSNPRRVTFLPITSGPRWSPDGRWIAFDALAPGLVRPDIWIVDANGGTPRRLTADPSYETLLSWTGDSAAVYVISDRTGMFEVWSIAINGGTATRVTQGGGLRAQESPDGRFLYYANDVPEVWRRSLRTPASEELVTTFPTGTHWGGDWFPGARGLYFLNDQTPGSFSIDLLPFGARHADSIRVITLTAPPARSVSAFAIAPDESWLVWAQDDYRNSDIMMIAR
jgi:Tol biopolymer transport system component/serine/threonine protein kinase